MFRSKSPIFPIDS